MWEVEDVIKDGGEVKAAYDRMAEDGVITQYELSTLQSMRQREKTLRLRH